MKLGTADTNNVAEKDSNVPILRTIRDAARDRIVKKRQGRKAKKKAKGKKKMKRARGEKKIKKDKRKKSKMETRKENKGGKGAKKSRASEDKKRKRKRRKNLRREKKNKSKRKKNLEKKKGKKGSKKHKTRKDSKQEAQRRKKKKSKKRKNKKSKRRQKLANRLKHRKGIAGRNSSSTGCPDLACINNAAAALKLEKDQIANFIKQKSRVENYMKTVTGKLGKKGQFEADAASLKSALGGDLENATCGGSTQRTVSAAAEVT